MPTETPRAQDALKTYLTRIGYRGEPEPGLATLTELTRLHLAAFPYGNLDVQLGRRVTRDPGHAFRKIVEEGRAGWCFEYNGLFAAMLEALGFRVLHLAGAVMREAAGDRMIGNHLTPVVVLDRLYLADPAMGIPDPVPLAPGPIEMGWRRYSLERTADGWWRFRNHPGAVPPSFDFAPGVDDPALLDRQNDVLQSDPASPFVRNALFQRHYPDRMESLAGRVHSIVDASGERVAELSTLNDYGRVLRENFGLLVPELVALWARVSMAPDNAFVRGVDEAA